ncbi:hypothetical protein [Actinoplanes sp. NPDC051494]|uniref:hypothetical protein n=1 Tax=Actinoplanes sp. NPDC051494 TaxID=3363907 RepID=UPI0037962044
MHKTRSWLRRPLIAALVVATFATSTAALTSPAAATTADIASLALDNVGHKACQTNSLGGSSYYSACTGNGGQPEYWCADFARWVWAQEDVDHTSDLTAAARSFYSYGVEYDTFSTTGPQVGDAAVFSKTGSDPTTANTNEIHHVGLVVSVSDGQVQIVSGDWGGTGSTQAEFARSSSVVKNAKISATPGYKSEFGRYLVGYVTPEGATAPTGRRNSGSVVYVPGNNYQVFGIKGQAGTSGGALYQDTWNATWGGWHSLGGNLGGSPAVTYHDARYDVFAVNDGGTATTGSVFQRTYQNGAWGDWHSIGGEFNNQFGAAAIYENGKYHVFAVSPFGTLMQRVWNGSWGDWQNLGGVLHGTPAVTYTGGRFDVFGTGSNGEMYQKSYTPSAGWGDWHSLGGDFKLGFGTAAVVDSGGGYHVFGINPAGALEERNYHGSWGDWLNIGGKLTGTPSVTLHDGRYDVFAISPTGGYAMYQRSYANGSWDDWHSIAGDFR